MRKADIKPGVVYAYQRSRAYGAPEPIVFLTAPADGPLYAQRDRRDRNDDTKPHYIQAEKWDTVSSGRSSLLARVVGYPAASLRQGNGKPEDLLNASLAGFEAVTNISDDEFAYRLETRLANIIGPWDEVSTARMERDRADRERREQGRAARNAALKRADAIIVTLMRAGIDAEPDSVFDAKAITLSLDEAEKLARLLNPEAGE